MVEILMTDCKIVECTLCKKQESLPRFDLTLANKSCFKKIAAVYPLASGIDIEKGEPASSKAFRLWKAFFEERFETAADELITFQPMIRCVLDSVKLNNFRNCWQYSFKGIAKQNPQLMILFGKDVVKHLLCHGGKTPQMSMLEGRHIKEEKLLGRPLDIFFFDTPESLILDKSVTGYRAIQYEQERVEMARVEIVSQIEALYKFCKERKLIK